MRPAGTYFDRFDLAAVLVLTALAFVLRFFSPIMPDFFVHPFQGPWLTDCVSSTPIDPVGDPGTLCGIAYPFNRGYGDPLSPPNGEVFDEVYFPTDAYDDVRGIEHKACVRPNPPSCDYFDPEPPLAKELIAAGMLGYGWYRATFQGAGGDYIDLGNNTFGWRIAACIVGTLCIPMMYLLARRLWPNRLFAIVAATLVCFDGMFFIQSRIGMIDIFPIFFILAAYFLFLVHIQSRSFARSMLSLVALGIVLGIGIAAKWIVLAALASIALFLLVRVVLRSLNIQFGPDGWPFLLSERDADSEMSRLVWPTYLAVGIVALAVIPLGIYLASWYPFFARGQFHNLADFVAYQRAAIDYHRTLTATHPYASPAWSWPLLARPVLYYAEYTRLGTDIFSGQPLMARITNLGNPWIWWTSIPCVLALPYYIVRHRSFPAAVILVGFITQYLPWFPITRVLFLYHMFGGLIFMVMALAFVLANVANNLRPQGRTMLAVAHLGLAVLFFAYFYPQWAGVPLSVPAYYISVETPPWGPKLWLVNCKPDLPAKQPQLFCWN